MSHSVTITTPFLSPEEVASRLGVSRQRQREIAEIVGSKIPSTQRTGLRATQRSNSKTSRRIAKKIGVMQRQPAKSTRRTVSSAETKD